MINDKYTTNWRKRKDVVNSLYRRSSTLGGRQTNRSYLQFLHRYAINKREAHNNWQSLKVHVHQLLLPQQKLHHVIMKTLWGFNYSRTSSA